MDTQTTSPTKGKIFSDFPSPLQRADFEQCGVEFDDNGQPIWYTVGEWIDELDRKLVAHFGEEYRELANKRRSGWNRLGAQTFSKL